MNDHAGSMKKLKASEMTEPGWYWMFFSDERPALKMVDSYQMAVIVDTDIRYVKAEPPKVCRWKFAGSLDMPFYALSCNDIFANIEMGKSFTYCPYCSGHIETEE